MRAKIYETLINPLFTIKLIKYISVALILHLITDGLHGSLIEIASGKYLSVLQVKYLL